MRHIAIIGSGPAGYYTAEAAQKQWGDDVRIDIFDMLPVPYGLIRTGVAPDHQSIKAVSNRYEKVALSDNVGFVGKRMLPIAEIRFDTLPHGTWPIVSYAAKWIPGSPEDEGTLPICPAEVPDDLEAAIGKVARDAWIYVSGGEGYGRVDLRVNGDGVPYVLEVNPCPDLSSNAGLARMGRAFGWSYDDLVMHVVDEALMRSQSHTAAAALVSGVSAA